MVPDTRISAPFALGNCYLYPNPKLFLILNKLSESVSENIQIRLIRIRIWSRFRTDNPYPFSALIATQLVLLLLVMCITWSSRRQPLVLWNYSFCWKNLVLWNYPMLSYRNQDKLADHAAIDFYLLISLGAIHSVPSFLLELFKSVREMNILRCVDRN